MKRSIFTTFLLATAVLLISCGGYNPNTTQSSSKIKTRAFVSNSFGGLLDIVDYAKDQQVFGTVSIGTSPQMMVVSDDRSRTLVFDAGSNSVAVVDDTAEKSLGSVALTDATESMDISPDNKTAYIAVRNAPVTGSVSGSIYVVDLTSETATTTINVPLVRQLALNSAGTFVVALTTDPVTGAPQGQISIVDTAKKQVTATISAASDPAYATSVNRPIQAVFSSDSSKAYIVNCGPECGGTAASVSVLDMSTGHMVGGSTLPLDAATTAFLDGNTLYVAGTVAGVGGVLTPVTASGSTLTKGTPIAIGDGFHRIMGKGSNSKLFVGAKNCTNDAAVAHSGCLSIVDTGKGSAVVDEAKGFVTGMDAVPNRDVMYVVEGGELRIYDTTTSGELAGHLVDIFGEVSDVKMIDQK